ncbi:hypothetical protein PVK06_042351 [Gossypium arboreum]|uniref:Uncharacterized protein n=1 Tax=Gossypium arboreum TaxID=29729 RepID=A0ABR0MKF5_GOSAR|nr:hypothetical protein PVK06_042351 [Gossypium arboreum]
MVLSTILSQQMPPITAFCTTLCTIVAPCIYTFVPSILHLDTDAITSIDADTCIDTDVDINANINTHINIDVFGFCDIVWLFTDSVTNTHASLFYRGGSSVQPPFHGVEDRRWEAGTASHSSTKECNGDEDEVDGGDKNKDDGRDEDDYNDHNQKEELTPLVMGRNPTRPNQPLSCGTHSARRHR